MGSRSVAACATIAALVAMMQLAGAAHAQVDDGGIKGGLKSGVSQAVDPSERVNEAFDEAEGQICGHDPHSLACKVIGITAIGVAMIFIVLGVGEIAGRIHL